MVLLNFILALIVAIAIFVGERVYSGTYDASILLISFVATFWAGITYDVVSEYAVKLFNKEKNDGVYRG